jgi:hypothetical protein
VTGKAAVLAGRIMAELREIAMPVKRAEQGWDKARESRTTSSSTVLPSTCTVSTLGWNASLKGLPLLWMNLSRKGLTGTRNSSARWQ